MNIKQRIRIKLFRETIENDDKFAQYRKLSDDEVLELLDITVLPNAVSVTAVKYSFMFNLLFEQSRVKREVLIKDLEKITFFVNSLSKIEKVSIKYAVLVRFKTNSWRVEFFKFLKTPLNLDNESPGRKFMSKTKFKELFFFAKNLSRRAIKNERLPKF